MLHWFTGTKAEAKRAVELGCYFSINIEMLRNERHTGLIMGLPKDRLLTETDGPFVKGAEGTMRPRDVTLTLGSLARLLGSVSIEPLLHGLAWHCVIDHAGKIGRDASLKAFV